MADQVNSQNDRKTGKVLRAKDDFGFLSCDDLPDQDVYYRTAWVRGGTTLVVGDVVTFELRTVSEKPQAHNLRRLGEPETSAASIALPTEKPRPGLPRNDFLLNWAYFGYFPKVLRRLKDFALQEDWDFKNSPPDPDHPHPILHSYLLHTFGRLVLEKKICVNSGGTVAAFNTGLVDPRYEPIYALFEPNDEGRTPWELKNFCIAGEGPDGQNLVRNFGEFDVPPILSSGSV